MFPNYLRNLEVFRSNSTILCTYVLTSITSNCPDTLLLHVRPDVHSSSEDTLQKYYATGS